MADNPSAEFFNSLGLRYEEAFGHDPGLRDFVRKSLKLLAPSSSVLDIGSGTGIPTSQMVIQAGHKLQGIDFSSTMIEIARKQVPEGHYTEVNMLEYSPEQPFDAAFAMFSIFHFSREEMMQVGKQWPLWIKPNGYIFIGTMVAEDFPTTPDMFDADGLCGRGIEHTFMGHRIGNLLFTKLGWKTILEKSGFEIVFEETVNFQAPPEAHCDMEPHHYIAARRSA